MVKNLPASAGDEEDTSSILGQEDPLEYEMATHSSILAWEIPWMEETGRLYSMGSQRVRNYKQLIMHIQNIRTCMETPSRCCIVKASVTYIERRNRRVLITLAFVKIITR